MKDDLKVSIIIPVYNGLNYLREAIDSALAQTYKNLEVLVINDGSNDQGATRDIALSYGNRIRYFEKENGGVATALNLGIEKMEGDYFSWLSHDDVYTPNKIETQINYIKNENNNEIILYGGWFIINNKSEVVSLNNLEDSHSINDLNKPLYPLFKGLIHGCSLLIPKKCFAECGVFDESLRTTQDYHLWFQFLKKYDILYHNDLLLKSRDHDEQGSKKEISYFNEANDLWISFIDNTDEDLVERYTHSLELFYYKMAEHLEPTSLVNAFNHALNKYNEVKRSICFSIILPTYNRGYCIGDAIETILYQTFKDYEIIVVDDGSTDDTEMILRKYRDKIKYIKQKNQGVSRARNVGIEASNGKYIAFLDSDDLWSKTHLEEHYNVLERNILFAMSYNFAKIYDYSTGLEKKYDFAMEKSGHLYPEIVYIDQTRISTPSVVLRRCILEEVGLFDENLDMCEDLDLWRRISIKYQIKCIPNFLTKIRERDNQFEPNIYFKKRKIFLEKALIEDEKMSVSLISELYYDFYRKYYELGCDSKIIIKDLHDTLEEYPEILNLLLTDSYKEFFLPKNFAGKEKENHKKIIHLSELLNYLLKNKYTRSVVLNIIYPFLKISYSLYQKTLKGRI